MRLNIVRVQRRSEPWAAAEMQSLRDAALALREECFRALRIPQLVAWLSRRLEHGE